MRKYLAILIALGCLALWACSDGETAGPMDPVVPVGQTAEVVIQSVLARAIPASVTSLRFTATDAAGNRVFGPDTRPKAALITLIVPVSATNLQIEYLEGDTVVGLFNQALSLTAGGTQVINDPAFVDVNVNVLESITVNPSNASILVGNTQAFTATGNFSNSTSTPLGAGVAWASSDPSVATIDPSSGLATAVSAGTTTISATFQGITGQTTMTVTVVTPVPVATSLVFSQQPVNGQATVVLPTVSVQVRDQNNALLTTGTTQVTLALGNNPGAATLGGTLTAGTVGGVATFSDLTLSAAGNGCTLTASAPNLTGATSSAFNVRPAPGSAVVFAVPTVGALPAGIVTGPDNNLWFTEANPNVLGAKIGQITPAGVITEFSNGLSGNSVQLLGITSVPGSNLLYCTERNPGANGRLYFFDIATPANSSESILFNGGLPAGITLGPDGNVYYVLSSNAGDGPAIGRMVPPAANNLLTTVGFTANPTFTDIVAGPDGNLWCTENANAQLAVVTPGPGPGFVPVVAQELSTGVNPTAICSGPDGQLWYVRDGAAVDAVERMDTTGAVTGTFVLPVNSNPQDLCPGPDGNVWVTLTSQDGVSATSGLARITPAGVITIFSEPTLPGPVGICAGPDGNLWVCSSLGNVIGRVTP